MIGFDAALDGWDSGHAFGVIDYKHHITETPLGELSAFAHGFGGASMAHGVVRPELGFTGGVELKF